MVRASEKYSSTTLYTSYLMVPLRMLYIVTLIYIFKVTKFPEIYKYTTNISSYAFVIKNAQAADVPCTFPWTRRAPALELFLLWNTRTLYINVNLESIGTLPPVQYAHHRHKSTKADNENVPVLVLLNLSCAFDSDDRTILLRCLFIK